MNASTNTPAKLPEPRIYTALDFHPATPEGLRPYSEHLVAAFDHVDAIARLRAAGLIGAETYVLTDEDRRLQRNVSSFDEESRFEPITAQRHADWVSEMLCEVREGDKVIRGPSWVRVAP